MAHTLTSAQNDSWQQGRRQNTYKKQTQKLLNDSRLGPWASPGILSVHSSPAENWQAGTEQLPTPFLQGLFSVQWTHEENKGRGAVIMLVPSVFSVCSPWLLPIPCKDAHTTDQSNGQLSETLLTNFRRLLKAASCSFKLLPYSELLLIFQGPRLLLLWCFPKHSQEMCLMTCTTTPGSSQGMILALQLRQLWLQVSKVRHKICLSNFKGYLLSNNMFLQTTSVIWRY